MKYLISLIILAGTISGCAFTPQVATIAPQVEFPRSSVGNGTYVVVDVADERPEEAIGHRGSTYGAGAKITTNQDIAALFKQEISKGLASNGFTLVGERNSQAKHMKVEVRLLEYSTSTGFWTGGIHTKSALKVIAKDATDTYEQLYRTENEDRVVVVPSGASNEDYLNAVVEDILLEVFKDRSLLAFLARKSTLATTN